MRTSDLRVVRLNEGLGRTRVAVRRRPQMYCELMYLLLDILNTADEITVVVVTAREATESHPKATVDHGRLEALLEMLPLEVHLL